MTNKNFLCVFLGICFICITGCSNSSVTIDSEPQCLTYEVTASTASEDSVLGTYVIKFTPKDRTIIEEKSYTLYIQNGVSDIYNTKKYTYDQRYQLIHYSESERYNSKEKYARVASINYDSESIVVSFSENSSNPKTLILNNSMPYSINSSFVLSLVLGYRPDMSASWSCYEGEGFEDHYEYLGCELIDNALLGETECRIIRQNGLFSTTYWINSDGIIVKIEQQMDANYTVSFNLKGA